MKGERNSAGINPRTILIIQQPASIARHHNGTKISSYWPIGVTVAPGVKMARQNRQKRGQKKAAAAGRLRSDAIENMLTITLLEKGATSTYSLP